MGNIMAAIGRRAGPAVVNFLDQQEQQAVQREHWMKNYQLKSRGVAMQEAEAKRQEQQWQYQKREIDRTLKEEHAWMPAEFFMKDIMSFPEYGNKLMGAAQVRGLVKKEGNTWITTSHNAKKLRGWLGQNPHFMVDLYNTKNQELNKQRQELSVQLQETMQKSPQNEKKITVISNAINSLSRQMDANNVKIVGVKEATKMRMEAERKQREFQAKTINKLREIEFEQRKMGERQKDVEKYKSTLPSKGEAGWKPTSFEEWKTNVAIPNGIDPTRYEFDIWMANAKSRTNPAVALVFKAHGADSLFGIRPHDRQKLMEAVSLAEKYSGNMTPAQAAKRAMKETDQKYESIRGLQEKKGGFSLFGKQIISGNREEVVETLREIMQKRQVTESEIIDILTPRGWTKEESLGIANDAASERR